ncbi:MAG TPA: hypothetical protein VHW25_19120 [Steroidobacteraceae bacterium]|nr:hypothetical protein [Steroidobacteraceae bacterium]
MPMSMKRTCAQGHVFRKSTDCPTCPVCEAARAPRAGMLSLLSAPARRAMERAGITTAADLARYSQKEILALHGVGPSTLPTLKSPLRAAGLSFRQAASRAGIKR